MKALLAESPDYLWGARQLCDWLEAVGDFDGFLERTERLVADAPTVAPHHTYFGDALVRHDRLEEAIRAFERAAALDPFDPYPTERAIELRLAQDDLDGAREVLARAKPSLSVLFGDQLQLRIESAAKV